mgnify:CR=1 FL=1
MRNIYDLANELERGIRALPEYKNLVEKKEAIATDAEASALFKEFTDFQEDFYAKMQAGTMPTAEEQAAVQLLPPAFRAGHQPADRSDPRGNRHVADLAGQPQPQPARH